MERTNTAVFNLFKGHGHLTIRYSSFKCKSVPLSVSSFSTIPILNDKTLVLTPIYLVTTSIKNDTCHLVSWNRHVMSLNSLHFLAVLIEVQVRIIMLPGKVIGTCVQSLVQSNCFVLIISCAHYLRMWHLPWIALMSQPNPWYSCRSILFLSPRLL